MFESTKIFAPDFSASMDDSIASGENLMKSINPKSAVVWTIRLTTCQWSGENP
jgi:hypothetical protein